MATIKKAQLGGLIKKGIKAASSSNKVVIPPGLQKSLKKSQSGPTKITQYSSEAEKIAAGGPTKLQKSKTVNKFDPNYEKPYKVKKQPKTDKYGFDTRPDRNGGTHKAQAGITAKKKPQTIEEASYNSPLAVKMRKTLNKQKAALKKRAWSDSSLEPEKKKMKNGGSLSGLTASTKRDKGTDPKGAFTKVQKKTLAGAKGKASLTKDKQLGATKMAKSGTKMSKK